MCLSRALVICCDRKGRSGWVIYKQPSKKPNLHQSELRIFHAFLDVLARHLKPERFFTRPILLLIFRRKGSKDSGKRQLLVQFLKLYFDFALLQLILLIFLLLPACIITPLPNKKCWEKLAANLSKLRLTPTISTISTSAQAIFNTTRPFLVTGRTKRLITSG